MLYLIFDANYIKNNREIYSGKMTKTILFLNNIASL